MLIRVNETTWIHTVDVQKIYVSHTKFHDNSRFFVNIETDGEIVTNCFNDKAAAITEANKLADIINRVEDEMS